MHRTTVMLPPDLKARAVRRAREQGVSLGEFIRQALAAAVEQPAPARAADPLFSDDAVFKGEVPPDISRNHDRYLYDYDEP